MTIKQLTWRQIFPLTIISFGTFTKWWYVSPVDAPDTMMAGFPLAFVGDGWFTSMSLQFFLIEFGFDFFIYFLFWFIIMLFIKRIFSQLTFSKHISSVLWTFAIITMSFWIFIFTISENHIKIKRDWDMQVLETGYKFTWTHKDKPGLAK